MTAYCVACRGLSEIVDPVYVTMANGRPATQVHCGNIRDGLICGTHLHLLGGAGKVTLTTMAAIEPKHGTRLPMKHADVNSVTNQMVMLGWTLSVNMVAPEPPENFGAMVRVTITCHRDAEGNPFKEVGVGSGFDEALNEARLKTMRHDHAHVTVDDAVPV